MTAMVLRAYHCPIFSNRNTSNFYTPFPQFVSLSPSFPLNPIMLASLPKIPIHLHSPICARAHAYLSPPFLPQQFFSLSLLWA